MRELHERLGALGLAPGVDVATVFTDATAVVVEAFQRSRGLPITGEVDAITWSSLVEAGWQLGQRLLYLSRSLMRGDDVAELQVRLAQLGFNPGRIDGIFGHLLDGALREFQRNCALTGTGVLDRSTLVELQRLSATMPDRRLVNDARDRAGFNESPTGPVVIWGESELARRVARELASRVVVVELPGVTTDQVADYANVNRAALVLSVQRHEGITGVHLHYWASYRSHSRQGARLSSDVAAAFSRLRTLPRVEVTGMALPILRETRMTTLHVEHDALSKQEFHDTATVIAESIVEFIHRNRVEPDTD